MPVNADIAFIVAGPAGDAGEMTKQGGAGVFRILLFPAIMARHKRVPAACVNHQPGPPNSFVAVAILATHHRLALFKVDASYGG